MFLRLKAAIILSSPLSNRMCINYIAGIVKGKGQKPLAVNGMPDHIHILLGLKPVMRISDLIRDIKNNACNFINEDRKSTRLNSSHGYISYAVFCLKKKTNNPHLNLLGSE